MKIASNNIHVVHLKLIHWVHCTTCSTVPLPKLVAASHRHSFPRATQEQRQLPTDSRPSLYLFPYATRRSQS